MASSVAWVAQGAREAQGVRDAYARAESFSDRTRDLVVNLPGTPTWLPNTQQFWYRRTIKGGAEFVLVDAAAGTKRPAFDHARLATALSAAAGRPYTATDLPLISIDFTADRQAIEFTITAAGGPAAGAGANAAASTTAAAGRWRC